MCLVIVPFLVLKRLSVFGLTHCFERGSQEITLTFRLRGVIALGEKVYVRMPWMTTGECKNKAGSDIGTDSFQVGRLDQ